MSYMPFAGTLNYDDNCYAFSSVWKIWACTPGQLFEYRQLYPSSVDSVFNYQGNMNIGEISENTPRDGGRFVYSWPESPEDALGARQCIVSGWWAAGRDIVYVDGAPMIREFARLPESERIARNTNPATWEIG